MRETDCALGPSARRFDWARVRVWLAWMALGGVGNMKNWLYQGRKEMRT